MMPYILIGIFLVATIVGYILIKNVPTLLHTPLMSGMNALSGITILGALAVTAAAVALDSKILGFFAIALAMVNVVGGFGVTARMLEMFKKEDK